MNYFRCVTQLNNYLGKINWIVYFYGHVLTVYNDKSIMQNDKKICHFDNKSCQKNNKFSYGYTMWNQYFTCKICVCAHLTQTWYEKRA